MPLWEWLLDAAGLLLAAVVLFALALVVRRRWLARQGAVFELSLNTRSATSGLGWTLGLGLYGDDQLEWFRAFSLSWRPRHSFRRNGLRVLRRRSPQGAETFSLYSGHVILECHSDAGPIQLALSRDSSTALLAWLESAPPGHELKTVV